MNTPIETQRDGLADGQDWLIIAEDRELGAQLRAELASRGRGTVAEFTTDGGLAKSCDERALAGTRRGIIMLSARTSENAAATSCCGLAVSLVQKLQYAALRRPPALWFVTRSIQSGVAPFEPAHAALWGIARSMRYEHPELDCRCVELSSPSDPRQMARLVDELLAGSREELVAVREEGRFVGRLTQFTPDASVSATPLVDGTVLVAGDEPPSCLRVIGWVLGLSPALRVIAVRRSADEAASAQESAELAAAFGERVRLIQCNPLAPGELERVLQLESARGMHLTGFVCVASAASAQPLREWSESEFDISLQRAVDLAWRLHTLSTTLALSRFVLFSEHVGMLGAPSEALPAAVAAVHDSLARFRRADGLPAQAISCGPLAQEPGTSSAGRNAQGSAGIASLSLDEAARGFRLLVGNGSSDSCALVALDFRQRVESHPTLTRSRFLSRLAQAAPLGERGDEAPDGSPWRRTLLQTAAGRRVEVFQDLVRRQVALLLGAEPSSIDLLAPFKSLGMDSYMGLELRNSLERDLGERLPTTLIWTYPTVSSLVIHLSDLLRLTAEREKSTEQPRTRELPQDILMENVQSLSLEEKSALLSATLASLADVR